MALQSSRKSLIQSTDGQKTTDKGKNERDIDKEKLNQNSIFHHIQVKCIECLSVEVMKHLEDNKTEYLDNLGGREEFLMQDRKQATLLSFLSFFFLSRKLKRTTTTKKDKTRSLLKLCLLKFS